MKGGEFVDQLRDCRLLKKDFVVCWFLIGSFVGFIMKALCYIPIICVSNLSWQFKFRTHELLTGSTDKSTTRSGI